MAIYHLTAKIFSRAKGQNAVASAAYRSGEKLLDQTENKLHDYTAKRGIIHTEILLPENAPAEYRDRQMLWNNVEKIEKRKDAQLAREFEVALPAELSRTNQIALARSFAAQLVAEGMCVDLCIHDKGDGNPHAHILTTTREVTAGGFGKKRRDWNAKEKLVEWRQTWERVANNALELAGRDERIDCRTLEAQGIDREPQIHLGVAVCAMERKGFATERGDRAREIAAANAAIDAKKNEMERLQTEADELYARIAEARERIRRDEEEEARQPKGETFDKWLRDQPSVDDRRRQNEELRSVVAAWDKKRDKAVEERTRDQIAEAEAAVRAETAAIQERRDAISERKRVICDEDHEDYDPPIEGYKPRFDDFTDVINPWTYIKAAGRWLISPVDAEAVAKELDELEKEDDQLRSKQISLERNYQNKTKPAILGKAGEEYDAEHADEKGAIDELRGQVQRFDTARYAKLEHIEEALKHMRNGVLRWEHLRKEARILRASYDEADKTHDSEVICRISPILGKVDRVIEWNRQRDAAREIGRSAGIERD